MRNEFTELTFFLLQKSDEAYRMEETATSYMQPYLRGMQRSYNEILKWIKENVKDEESDD